ncbi:MAG TPA: imidazole glycerol phosphate synthase subunit HisH [Ktedonobacteraceae bacterium]|nr:imidazole glycerol phosphate synthase subunit HisH [Ktedonobacteraceae bacterium]
MIAIVDYGAGNMHSIAHALEHVGARVRVTDDPRLVLEAEAVVLPGVGQARSAMAQMTAKGLDEAIREATEQSKPFLGICLGMQLLADHHAEGEVDGLKLFRGSVRRIPEGLKIPEIGWNQVQPSRENLPIFEHIPPASYFYFLHSYYVEPLDQAGVAATTDYGSPYCSVIATERVWGTQFHPEKSGEMGLQMLRNFLKWVRK